MWVEMQKRNRQHALRKSLPDALDMIVLCVEGGVSLVAAIYRVAAELHMVHPVLAIEMSIVQRAVELGMSPGEALKKFSERCGLQEVGNLASVMIQSDRYGASVSNALRIFAEEWRTERQQKAEETAQKAAVKILFPMLLCIFPAVFMVLLGPAAFQIANLFNGGPR
jgi:tight adherence protein C